MKANAFCEPHVAPWTIQTLCTFSLLHEGMLMDPMSWEFPEDNHITLIQDDHVQPRGNRYPILHFSFGSFHLIFLSIGNNGIGIIQGSPEEFNKLWVSTIIMVRSFYYLLQSWGAIYRYKHRYLERNFIDTLHLFNRAIAAASSNLYHFTSLNFFLPVVIHETQILSCGVGFKSSQKIVDCTHNSHANIVPIGTSCQAW